MNSNSSEKSMTSSVASRRKFHLPLEFYDLLLVTAVNVFMLGFYPSSGTSFGVIPFVQHLILTMALVWVCRSICGVYKQIWRYGSPKAYIRLIAADFFIGTTLSH